MSGSKPSTYLCAGLFLQIHAAGYGSYDCGYLLNRLGSPPIFPGMPERGSRGSVALQLPIQFDGGTIHITKRSTTLDLSPSSAPSTPSYSPRANASGVPRSRRRDRSGDAAAGWFTAGAKRNSPAVKCFATFCRPEPGDGVDAATIPLDASGWAERIENARTLEVHFIESLLKIISPIGTIQHLRKDSPQGDLALAFMRSEGYAPQLREKCPCFFVFGHLRPWLIFRPIFPDPQPHRRTTPSDPISPQESQEGHDITAKPAWLNVLETIPLAKRWYFVKATAAWTKKELTMSPATDPCHF
ncbi:hypothetical protein FB451DRAFT_1359061 [Mycena latifolia]|nr:hypothetical protein FB451DRAFT_1359061 [Mycena latifolia]